MTKKEFLKNISDNNFTCDMVSCVVCEKYIGKSCLSNEWSVRKHLKYFYDKEMIKKNLERW